MFRYNISAESPAKSTLSQGHGLSTGGGVSIHIYIYTYTYNVYLFIYFLSSRLKSVRRTREYWGLGFRGFSKGSKTTEGRWKASFLGL